MEKKKRPFSSYKTLTDLSSVLSKFNIYGSSLSAVPQFTPSSLSLANDDDELQQCMNDIKRKLRNLGTLIPDSNEATRNEYISAILHAAIHISRRESDKEISLLPQLQIAGDENCGRVDYTIISLEELICITESKQYLVNIGFIQNVIQCESVPQTNRKKRKTGVAFGDCEYLYGVITTATEWYFLSYSPEKISCSFKEQIIINFSETFLKKFRGRIRPKKKSKTSVTDYCWFIER
ncbi:hypothetical protein C1646_700029 [Rhizophagus diaphanus]|nr:hypothetical protein C1646_700029 [Rhizophagus diaphanus] [Rhizophagus sp. MUCL 43196]